MRNQEAFCVPIRRSAAEKLLEVGEVGLLGKVDHEKSARRRRIGRHRSDWRARAVQRQGAVQVRRLNPGVVPCM